ncbi:MAG: ATP-binding protein [Pirellulaceae bacterium]
MHYRNILVIDDNEAIHRDFGKIFSVCEHRKDLDSFEAELFGDEIDVEPNRVDFKLTFASQGRDGLAALENAIENKTVFGAAFVDMRMPPGWDGVETIENLWKADPDLQVVICTAFSDKSMDDITDRLGVTDQLLILKKPFDEIEIVQLARSLSEKRRLIASSRLRMNELQQLVESQDQKLQLAHKDAEILIDSLSSVLISLDESGVVSRWNPVASETFGISSESAIGEKLSYLPIDWLNWPALSDVLRDAVDVQHKNVEIQFKDQQGMLNTLDATICPILNDATSKARLILASDMTVQKAMRSQLDQAQRLESVGQLAAGVAHEINTPMQYVGDNIRFVAKSIDRVMPLLDCLKVLADRNATDEQLREVRGLIPESVTASKLTATLEQIPEALQDSIDGVEQVSKIVAAMKEFSHPGTDQKAPVCINHILQSTITVAKNEWKYIADMTTHFDDDLIKVDALPSELNQAFLNLVVNASHAIGDRVAAGDYPKGQITITTRADGDHAEITIQDNGGGIPSSARKRVFEPFFTTKDVGKGTGQGLAIAFNVIVKKHGGQLTFDVQESEGTTFKILLPFQSVDVLEVDNLETIQLHGSTK